MPDLIHDPLVLLLLLMGGLTVVCIGLRVLAAIIDGHMQRHDLATLRRMAVIGTRHERTSAARRVC